MMVYNLRVSIPYTRTLSGTVHSVIDRQTDRQYDANRVSYYSTIGWNEADNSTNSAPWQLQVPGAGPAVIDEFTMH